MTAAETLDTHSDTRPLYNAEGHRILHIRSLALYGFRNYASQRIEVSAAPVVLAGHNGAGKTNILEALSLLTPGRGLRKAKLGDMDSRQQGQWSPWVIAAQAEGMQGAVQIGTSREPTDSEDSSDKRLTRIDGKPVRGQAELARHLAMIWLTPQMEQLFQEGASAARKFLDRLVYTFDADHAGRVTEYEFAMRERNRLLALPHAADPSWLDALEQTMAEVGAAIASARLNTVEHMNTTIQQSPLSFPKAWVHVHGAVEDALAAGTPAVHVEAASKDTLKASRRQDAAAGRSLHGVHRSEMRVIHQLKQIPAESCSTGEQKALLLSMVLAQARASARWRGVVPLLLLDEVAAHLDATRRLELFEEICQIGAQTWLTGTDRSLFEGMQGKAQFFLVEGGRAVPQP